MRVSYDTMYAEFVRVLEKRGFTPKQSALSAKLYADASRDGVYTHGLNRFPKFINSIDKGCVDIHAVPVLKESFGFFERYDGQKGPGNLNAHACMKRAIELAKQNAIGCVALSNTNHWMRPGNYGLMAAEENCIGILWTNTVPNMPPWGGRDAKLGNNPVVFAIPHKDSPVLVDVAMSMFSYGKLESYARSGRELPVDGGYNKAQEITKNAAEILETHQCIPIGYWKGSGLSLALDLIASVLAGGRTSRMVGELPAETELSQVFIAVSLDSFGDREQLLQNIDDTLNDLKNSAPVNPDRPVYYPGENMMRTREENMELGIPVDEEIWQKVLDM
ncbi:3-dehydro-L-gulonate 2-dehydrogenase [Clostridium sp. chh4-2]|uniref:3-dehydro-L-gulonate 2-dehydrogenase n=1 Tax=Clostridium sp. chh4-2 TaxID=2067550 RepID=UPI000CCE58D4|nr:3-dehydro-L-gulonate 2-dehydrogenase [Clostridium sp. chh4-2]PNV62360.1 3-dehydro-L-gulonate 2-dehydrogenase [Clostridium sp. chh4-2]